MNFPAWSLASLAFSSLFSMLESGAHGALCSPQFLGPLGSAQGVPERRPNGLQEMGAKPQRIHGPPFDPMSTPLRMPCPLRWDPMRPQWHLMNTPPLPHWAVEQLHVVATLAPITRQKKTLTSSFTSEALPYVVHGYIIISSAAKRRSRHRACV